MTAASVLEGPAGRAVRADLRETPGEFRGFIVDEWTVHPDQGHAWQLVMAHDDGDYLLTLARIDPVRALLGLVFRRQRDRAVEMPVAIPVTPENRAHARAFTRQIARACVKGTLPLPPRTGHELAVWQFTGVLFLAVTKATTAAAAGKA